MVAFGRLEVPAYLEKIFSEYFKGRTTETSAGSQQIEIEVTCGVPQGSVVGPLLWNITYDSVLHLQLPMGSDLLGFTDDTMVIASASSILDLESKANEALHLVFGEIRGLGLSLAVNKTEAVLFISKCKFREPTLRMDGQTLELKPEMKYLGMTIQRSLLFKSHVSEAAKAERVANSLGRLTPNIGGPKELRRRLYVVVIQ